MFAQASQCSLLGNERFRMREIKFRALDKGKKYWIEKMNIFHGDFTGYFGITGTASEGIEIMQFTGLKDKNGKEIYEGDILKQGEGEHETLIEVRFGTGTFDSGCYGFTGFYGVYVKVGFGGGFKKGDLCEDMDEITKEECDRREVIGNIYENQELLKGDK